MADALFFAQLLTWVTRPIPLSRTPDPGPRTPDPGPGPRTPDPGPRTPDPGPRTPDSNPPDGPWTRVLAPDPRV